MKPILSIFLFFFITTTALGQSHKNKSIPVKLKELKALLNESDMFTPEMTDSLEINDKIKKQLCALLKSPGIEKYNLEKEFKGTGIGTTHSNDNRLWFYTWFENTGGSFKSNLTIIQYRTKTNKTEGIVVDNSIADENDIVFESNGASYTQIIKLPSKNKNLYLCIGGVTGCNTCSAVVATVIGLTSKNIDLRYPAFKNKEANNYGDQAFQERVPTFIMDSRVDDIKQFEYNSVTHTIHYQYIPDDNTPIKISEDEPYNPDAKPIVGLLKWNGTFFTETLVGQKVTN